MEGVYAEKERDLIYELALLYFVELEDYSKSREAVESIKEPEDFARDFAELCAFMDEQIPAVTERDTELLLERLKTEIPDPEDERYAYCIARGCEKLKEAQAEEPQDDKMTETAEASGDMPGDGQETAEGQ